MKPPPKQFYFLQTGGGFPLAPCDTIKSLKGRKDMLMVGHTGRTVAKQLQLQCVACVLWSENEGFYNTIKAKKLCFIQLKRGVCSFAKLGGILQSGFRLRRKTMQAPIPCCPQEQFNNYLVAFRCASIRRADDASKHQRQGVKGKKGDALRRGKKGKRGGTPIL